MPIQTGTATDHKNLLSLLRTFALANGWVEEAYTTQVGLVDADELYLRGLGSTETENVHVNFQTFGDAFNDIFTWRVRGATAYNGGATFETQPNTGPRSILVLSDNAMNYWFYVSDRRIIVVVQVGVAYFAMYAGFFLPYATPLEYPFPLYIAATSDIDVGPAVLNAGYRNFADPGGLAAYIRDFSGIWREVRNHGFAAAQEDSYQNLSGSQPYTMWPYNPGQVNLGNSDTVAAWDIRPPTGAPNALPLLPLQLVSGRYAEPALGLLENAFWCPGFALSSEQTFQLGSAVATGLLTLTGNLAAADTISIGTDVAATAQFVNATTTNFADGDTVTIDARVYTFQTVLTNVDGNVLIGTDIADSLSHLVAAINLGAGSGTDYAAATVLHPTVTAAAVGTSRMSATAKSTGEAGNSIVTGTTSANAFWTSATLLGGEEVRVYTMRASVNDSSPVDEIVIGATAADTRDNIVAALNGGTGAGTAYSIGTEFNGDVRAEQDGTQNVSVIARQFGTNGNSIATTETAANASWGGATLSGGGGNETYRVFQNGNRTGRNHFFAVLEV